MIRETFQLFSGIGPWREKDLWARGIARWDDFPSEGDVLSPKLDGPLRAAIASAREALRERDVAKLAALIPAREHWRLYGELGDQAVFFDIEADAKENPRPTVVSLFDAEGLHVFIQGRNLDALPAALARWPIWVSFNGACYDVPILRRHFGGLEDPPVHLDLRFICRKLRLTGGLKEIEQRLGIGRPPHLKGVNGWDAVLLWRAYLQSGEVEALRFLVEYNLYDSFQLRTVMDRLYNGVARDLGCEVPEIPVFDRGEILYDVSRLLLAIGPTRHDRQVLERARASLDYDVRQGPGSARYLL